VRDTLPAEAVAALEESQRTVSGALADAVLSTDAPPSSGEAWRNVIFSVAGEAALPTAKPSRRSTPPSSADERPAGGWLSRSSTRHSWTDRLRAAAAPQVPA